MKIWLAKNTTLGSFPRFRRWVGGVWQQWWDGMEMHFVWYYRGTERRTDPPHAYCDVDGFTQEEIYP